MNQNVLSRMNVPQVNVSAQQPTSSKLVIMNEQNGCLLGAYHKNGDITYFSSCNSFDVPVAFGNPAVTMEIKQGILEQKPDFYKDVTINFKSVAMFANTGNRKSMVHLVDARRQVFEGYIGDYVFTTTQAYLDEGRFPLATRADVFIANGGKHNLVRDNMCTPAMKDLIVNLIREYKNTVKYVKAMEDVEYFIRLQRTRSSVQYQAQRNPGYGRAVNNNVNAGTTTSTPKISFGARNIVVNIDNMNGGDDDYEPEF